MSNPLESYIGLRRMDENKRKGYLLDRGMSEQDADDLLNATFPARIHSENRPVLQPVKSKFHEAMERCKARLEQAKAEDKPVEEQKSLSMFELHQIHNRYMLGGENKNDTASYKNPELYRSESINWFEHEFHNSGAKFACITGKPGSGKTFATVAYINKIAKVEFNPPGPIGEPPTVRTSNACFVNAYKLEDMVNDKRKFREELDRYCKVPILAINDLGIEADTQTFQGGHFMRYFNYLMDQRYEFHNRITILTSNAKWDAFKVAYGDRIVSRLAESGFRLETSEHDLRRDIGAGVVLTAAEGDMRRG